MFESLDDAARGRVKRWEAPRIGRVAPPDAVLPAFGDAPRVVATGGASVAPAAFSGVDDPGSGSEGGQGAGSESSAGSGKAAADTSADARSRSPEATPSPPVERVDVGTSADDVALQRRFEEGRRQGWAEAQAARREAVIDESAGLLASLARARDARDSLLEDELLALARAMAKLVVRRELAHDGGVMSAMVHEALERLPRLADAPLVRLHPVDAEALSRALPANAAERAGSGEHGGKASEPGAVKIVADETLARGDCRIESGATLIDAGIDAWLERIGVHHGSHAPLDGTMSDTDTDSAAGAGSEVRTAADAGTSSVTACGEDAGAGDVEDGVVADEHTPDEIASTSTTYAGK